MTKANVDAKGRSSDLKLKISYFILLIVFAACMYASYVASQNKPQTILRKIEIGEVVPVGYMVNNGLLISDVDNMPLSPPKFNRTCGNWVPDGSMYHEKEKVEQFLTCKPDGFVSQGGIQYVYKRTIGGRKSKVWP